MGVSGPFIPCVAFAAHPGPGSACLGPVRLQGCALPVVRMGFRVSLPSGSNGTVYMEVNVLDHYCAPGLRRSCTRCTCAKSVFLKTACGLMRRVPAGCPRSKAKMDAYFAASIEEATKRRLAMEECTKRLYL